MEENKMNSNVRGSTPLSLVAQFDDIVRCVKVLTEGDAEEEFLRFLELHEKYRQDCEEMKKETERIQKELDKSLQSMSDLESKLYHARRLVEMETRARREAEHERDQIEKKMISVAEFVRHEINLKDETKEKLAFLNTLPRKRKSLNTHVEEKYGNEINSTGSFLSDLSITQSEDDLLDAHHSRNWKKHRPSLSKNSVPCVASKRSRLSGSGIGVASPIGSSKTPRRSSLRRSATQAAAGIQKHSLNVVDSERICATTKVTIPQNGTGAIRAESTIESMPVQADAADNIIVVEDSNITSPVKTPFKGATAPPMTPVTNKNKVSISSHMLKEISSPVQTQRAGLTRQHNFASRTFIRAEICAHCQKKIRFGSVGLRCRDCPVRCHGDCRYLLTISCVPTTGTPNTKGCLMGYVSDYAPCIPPMVPALIVHCVNEIETRGLNEVGIYRVSGSEREIKALKERFLRGKGTPRLDNIDVHVLCGCIKDFLRSLREPLIPTNMWKDFCNAVQNPTEANIQRDLYKAITAMPQANRDSLSFLILHFQRIAECREVLMPIENIARVFGPTIVGYSSPDPDQHAIFTEVYTQCTVMLNLLRIPSDYWTQYIALDSDKENGRSTSNVPATPTHNKESIYSLYATPLKSTLKKRKFHVTPSFSHKK